MLHPFFMGDAVKKTIIAVLMVLVIAGKSYAVPMIVIPAWVYGTSVALHVSAAVAGLYYAMKPGGSRSVSSAGDLSRPSNVTWVDLSSPSPSVVTKDISAKMSLSNAQMIADKKNADGSDKYPAAKTAFKGSNLPNVTANSQVGALVNTSYGKAVVVSTSVSSSTFASLTSSETTVDSGTGAIHFYAYGSPGPEGSNLWYSRTAVNLMPSDAMPPVVAYPPERVAENLSGSPTGGAVNASSAIQEELDKMFQDPDYVPTFSDDATGLPFVPPLSSSVATPNQLAVINSQAASTEAAASAVTSASNAAVSAAAAATAADARATSAVAAAAANPSDAGLAAAAAAAVAAADLARANANTTQAALDKLKAEQAAAAVTDAESKETAASMPSLGNDNTYDTNITAPEKKSILSLLQSQIGTSPLGAMLSGFSMSTSENDPVVSLGDFYGKALSIDFSKWQTTFSMVGTMLLVIMHGYAIFVVIRGW